MAKYTLERVRRRDPWTLRIEFGPKGAEVTTTAVVGKDLSSLREAGADAWLWVNMQRRKPFVRKTARVKRGEE